MHEGGEEEEEERRKRKGGRGEERCFRPSGLQWLCRPLKLCPFPLRIWYSVHHQAAQPSNPGPLALCARYRERPDLMHPSHPCTAAPRCSSCKPPSSSSSLSSSLSSSSPSSSETEGSLQGVSFTPPRWEGVPRLMGGGLVRADVLTEGVHPPPELSHSSCSIIHQDLRAVFSGHGLWAIQEGKRSLQDANRSRGRGERANEWRGC